MYLSAVKTVFITQLLLGVSLPGYSQYLFYSANHNNHLNAPRHFVDQLDHRSNTYFLKVSQKIKPYDNNIEYLYKYKDANYTFKTKKGENREKKSSISMTKKTSSRLIKKSVHKQYSVMYLKQHITKDATISIDNKKMLKLAFDWPIKGAIVKNFRQSKRKGIEIAGKIGQSVYAAEEGKVVYSGRWLVGFGNLLVIKHNPLYLSAYANNSLLLVKEGQRVSKGQVVAQVGHTPYRRAALHFEIRKNGKSVDPLRFLPNS